MTLYSIILFFHVAAVLGLFSSLSFELLCLAHLRQASDLGEVRRWIDPLPGIPLVALASILVVLFSGIYMVVRMAVFDLAWPKVAIVALLLIAPVGALAGKRMRAIRRGSAEATTMTPELRKRLHDRFLKVSLGVRTTVFFGIVLLMVAKPEFWQSIEIVACSAFLGLLLSLMAWRRAGELPARGELQGHLGEHASNPTRLHVTLAQLKVKDAESE